MRLILEFNEFMDRESKTRTKGLNDEEFLSIFRENCKNFSFDNDQLWRKSGNFGPFGFFYSQERKTTIVKSIQDAEDRLNEANKRLSEAQKQLSQAHVVISNIRNETKAAKVELLKSDANVAKKELTIRFNRAIATFRTKQQRLFDQLKLKIVLTVLTRSVLKAKETFGTKKRSRALINETIQKIEGDLFNE